LVIAAVVPLGLAARSHWLDLPQPWRAYSGEALWAVMFCFIFGAACPSAADSPGGFSGGAGGVDIGGLAGQARSLSRSMNA
jgi:hypothetical protein